MLELEITRPLTSPWSSPIWIIFKKLYQSGKRKLRIVLDYMELNDKTMDDKYLIPEIIELLKEQITLQP